VIECTMPDLIKILLTFSVILILLRKKLNIGYVMLIASATLFIMYRMRPSVILQSLTGAATSSVAIKLLLALSLIRMLEIVLRENEVLSRMMRSTKNFFRSKKAVIISMPLLIGMLPSLGGAYFSAPMVKEATSGLKMSQEEKAFINYWFRHPWEYILPLYPGILLASAVSMVPLYNLIAANFSYAVVLFCTGFLFSMRGMENTDLPERNRSARDSRHKRRIEGMSFVPVLAVLLLVVITRIDLYQALLLVVVPLFVVYRYSFRNILRVIRHGFAPEVVVLIFGVMLFKETMESSGSVANLSAFFLKKGIPTLPIICLLPFFTGLLTGLTVGFVGSTFPLLISFSGGAPIAIISLAFSAGYLGVLLSPVHLCLVLTKEYFRADLWGVYRKIIPSASFIFLAALIEYVILN
jgi:integral membrane protein (TIGR00529 family)